MDVEGIITASYACLPFMGGFIILFNSDVTTGAFVRKS